MRFIEPWLLAAMPLVALPILIHLINQRRFQTIRWGAMMFLLAANRLSRGYAKLRQWLIMLFRMLAIAGLIFAVSRPLASGWLGLAAGGKADTTIIILDRSPSMRQQGQGTIGSKLETGRQQLARSLGLLSSSRYVVIDSTTREPRDIESPQALLQMPEAETTSSSADLPALLQVARDYIEQNKSGRTEIWICSDVRSNDWNADSGRWQTLRDSFASLNQGVRFHLLAYPEISRQNVGLRVTQVRRVQTSDSAELLLSLRLVTEESSETPTTEGANPPVQSRSIPITFEIEGARSEVTVEMTSATFELKDHRIPLERTKMRGWGRVSIPADANPTDSEFFFVFDQPIVRQTLIVTEDPAVARPMELAASIAPDPNVRCTAEVTSPDLLGGVEWEKVSLVVWQAALPGEEAAKPLIDFVDRGGQVLFLPTQNATNDAVFGVRWLDWNEHGEGLPIETWRGDQDLLSRTQSGAALPVGNLLVRKYRGLSGELTPLAQLKGGAPLLARATTLRGGAYFLTTTASGGDSSLAADGVVLYVLMQRALALGAAVLGDTRELVAGETNPELATQWQALAGAKEAVSTAYVHHAGIYTSDGGKLFAINRASAEDQAAVLGDERVADLFRGLDFARVNDQAGSLEALIQEIWRVFVVAMIVALIVEAALCLPRLQPATPVSFAPLPKS